MQRIEFRTDAVVAIPGEIDGSRKSAVDTAGDVVVVAPTNNPSFFATLTARFTDGQTPDFDFLTDACVMSFRVLDIYGDTLSITPATEEERSLRLIPGQQASASYVVSVVAQQGDALTFRAVYSEVDGGLANLECSAAEASIMVSETTIG